MKLFIWEYVYDLTDNWHKEGGLAVIAKDLDSARKIIEGKAPNCSALNEQADFTTSVEEGEEKIFIFPDAGCC